MIKAVSELDFYLIFATLLLCTVGLIGLTGATYHQHGPEFVLKQGAFMIFGIFVMILLSRIKIERLIELAPVIYLFNLSLLALVPFFGKTVYGSSRWLSLGPFSIQPSELMKFSLLLFFVFVVDYSKKLGLKEVGVIGFAFIVPFLLTLKQPDLGTSIVFVIIMGCFLFFGGLKLRYFLLSGIALFVMSPFIWANLEEYQKQRIIAFLDPFKDYQKSGYQLIQSVVAVGSGGIDGKGLFSGTQTQLMFLPEKHTDFIFAVIAEELGTIGAMAVIMGFFIVFARLMWLSMRLKILTGRIFLATAGSVWMFQSSVNILMNMGWMPVVGMPLPFVSYGGSAILTFFAILGVCISFVRENAKRELSFEDV
ncbi:MAG: FtsW/RodA/SpoVE family cell cycle protein [Aquificaceae bacterium]